MEVVHDAVPVVGELASSVNRSKIGRDVSIINRTRREKAETPVLKEERNDIVSLVVLSGVIIRSIKALLDLMLRPASSQLAQPSAILYYRKGSDVARPPALPSPANQPFLPCWVKSHQLVKPLGHGTMRGQIVSDPPGNQGPSPTLQCPPSKSPST